MTQAYNRQRNRRGHVGATQQDLERADALKADKTTHSVGWPHFAQNGNCICLSSCCLGESGCKCKSGCAGQGHANCPNATER